MNDRDIPIRPLAEIAAKYAPQRTAGNLYAVTDRYTTECRRDLLGRRMYYLYDHAEGRVLGALGSRMTLEEAELRRISLGLVWLVERRSYREGY